VNRLPRRLAIVSMLVLAAWGAAGCGYVQPPALTISRSSSADPFYSFSADQLFSELSKSGGASDPSTTKPTSVPAEQVAELLTGKVRPIILQQLLDDKGIKPTDADKALVQRAAQQQQTPPSEDEIAFQTNYVALANALAETFFAQPGNDLETYGRQYYDARRDTFAQAAQTCLHVVTVDAPANPDDPEAGPTPAGIDGVKAQADAMRQRLNTETFEAVSADTGRSAANIPGGDLGCRPDAELPPDVIAGTKDVAVGAISPPTRWQMGWVIVRIDDRKPARTPAFEEIKTDVLSATKQSFGQQFVTKLLEETNKNFVVKVDPRFGRWSPEQGQVLTPSGSATPTTPTTSTTLPSLVDDRGSAGSGSAPSPSTP
jgi:hypothetical protein